MFEERLDAPMNAYISQWVALKKAMIRIRSTPNTLPYLAINMLEQMTHSPSNDFKTIKRRKGKEWLRQ